MPVARIVSESHLPLELNPPWFSTITLIPKGLAYSLKRRRPSAANLDPSS